MTLTVSAAGRVCLCELEGSVTVTEVIGVLSIVRRVKEEERAAIELLIHFDPCAAAALERASDVFLSALPAIAAGCAEVLLILPAAHVKPISRALCVASNDSLGVPPPLRFLDALDDALSWVQAQFPHEVLELRRRRLRSGIWKKHLMAD